MLKNIIIAWIIGLSFQATVLQANADTRLRVDTSVKVSGPGGMCRDVSVNFTYRGSAAAAKRLGLKLLRLRVDKTVNDYRTTHRPVKRYVISFRQRGQGVGRPTTLAGRVCFRNL